MTFFGIAHEVEMAISNHLNSRASNVHLPYTLKCLQPKYLQPIPKMWL